MSSGPKSGESTHPPAEAPRQGAEASRRTVESPRRTVEGLKCRTETQKPILTSPRHSADGRPAHV
jgi:hypothetical protein